MLGVIMIKGFADKETDALYSGRPVRRFPHEICRRAIAKLQIIDNAADIVKNSAFGAGVTLKF